MVAYVHDAKDRGAKPVPRPDWTWSGFLTVCRLFWRISALALEHRSDRILEDLSRAQEALHESQRRLGEITTVESTPPTIAAPGWEWAQELADSVGPILAQIEGVVGSGLGFRIVDGAVTSDPCVSVYVTRKYSAVTLARRHEEQIPPKVRDNKGRVLPTDVVAVGRLERQRYSGASIGTSLKGRGRTKGTIGAFAKDLDGAGVVGITAMHVSGLQEYPYANAPQVPITAPSLRDAPGAQTYGYLLRGTMKGIDAATFSLAPGSGGALPGASRPWIRGWRPMVYPSDAGTPVRLYGAQSGVQHGVIVNPGVALPDLNLDVAILASISTQRGDSGAALIDASGLVLGFLVGSFKTKSGWGPGYLRVFSPAQLVLKRLRCLIP